MLYIRTDMNDFIATGHMMRCLSIAEAAKESGEQAAFILADEQALDLVTGRGFDAVVLHTEWNHMETEIEIGALKKLVEGQSGGILLVDSYMASPSYLHALSTFIKTAYIDDLGMADYPVDLLVCYAGYWEKFHYPKRYQQAKLLLGMRYAPLGKQFRRPEKKVIRQRVENILLLSGGTDRYGLLEGLLGKIYKKGYQNIDVVCGQYYKEYEKLCRRFGRYANIHFHKAVKNMKDYMMRADLAVSAGGTALYELCACGTPAVSYSFADNQLDNVMYFQKENLIDYAGDVRGTDIFERVSQLMDASCSLYEQRKERSRKMQELVDGEGAARIAWELAAASRIDV